MNQPWSDGFAHNEAALGMNGLTVDQLFKERLSFPDRDDGSLWQGTPQLLIKHTDGTTTQHGAGLGMMAPRPFHALAHQRLVAEQFAVVARHQPQTTEGPMQPFQRIAGIKHFKRVLKWVATAPIHRGIDLNVSPGEHQKRGTELIDGDAQHAMHVQHRQGSEIQDPLGHAGKTLVQMVGQIDRTDRKDGIARQTNKKHPFI